MTRLRSATVAGYALVAGFLAARLAILNGGKVFTSYDTFSYAYRHDPAWDRGALVSFVGHAPRPWGVPLFYAMFGSDTGRALGQWTLGTAAWLLLAWAVAASFRHGPVRLGVLAATLTLGLLRPVSSWDFAILSESLSISLGVLTLAFFLFWLRLKSPMWLVPLVVSGVWWIFTRVDMFVLALPIIAALAWQAWRSRRDSAPAVIAAAAVLLCAVGWSYVSAPTYLNTLQRWSFAPQLGHERGLLMYRLRINVFPDRRVKEVFERDFAMPDCPGADRVAAGSSWAVDEFAAEVAKCPELNAWVDENIDGLWVRYAETAPALFAGQVGRLTSDALAGAAYAETPRVLPGPVEKLAFPRSHALALTLLGGAVLIVMALLAGAARTHTVMLTTALAMQATAVASAVLTVLVSAGEVWRFGIQEAIAIRIGMIIIAGCALDGLLDRLAARTRSHGGD